MMICTLPTFNMEPKKDGFQKESPIPGCHFQVLCQSSGVYHIARQGEPPAKDPSNSQAYIQTYIQAYIQNKAEAIHTNIHTSIYIKQSRSNTHKHTYKLTYKHTYKSKQTHTYKQYSQKQSRHIHNNALPTAPHKTKQQKNITLYNSKYCIR